MRGAVRTMASQTSLPLTQLPRRANSRQPPTTWP
jgi:hypothetical protein